MVGVHGGQFNSVSLTAKSATILQTNQIFLGMQQHDRY